MANEYYATTGSPATSSQGASATMRSEFTSVAAGFDKLPALAGNGSKLVQINSGGTAMAAIALTVGALLFGGAAGALGQDGTNLFWDNTAKRLGIGNAAPTVALDVTGAGKFSTGLTVGTTITASTSVVTPMVGPTTDVTFNLQVNGGNRWGIATSAGVAGAAAYTLFPLGDATQDFGSASTRIRNAFVTIIDSGTAGSLSLRTNNGLTQALINNAAVAPDRPININAGQSGVLNATISVGNGVGFAYSTGDNSHQFYTDASTLMQFEITRTVGASRHIFVTGSNGGNPTLGVTAGSLAITPSVVMASSLVWGTGLANFGTITKRKTADESVTSSITPQADDDLTFAIGANEEWVVTFYIHVGPSLNVTGLVAGFTVPAGATMKVTGSLVGSASSSSLGNAIAFTTATSGVSFLGPSGATLGSTAFGILSGQLWVSNGATPGSVTLQWAQATNSGTALTFAKGSSLHATRVV